MPDRDFKLGRLKGQWVATWTEDGQRRRYRLFPRSDGGQPRREAEDVLKLLAGQFQRHSDPTVETIWEAYRKEKQGRRVTVAMGFEWRAMKPFWGHLRPSEVTIEKCREWAALRRAAGKHDGTIWTELGHLRTALKWAADRKIITDAPKVERPPKPAPKERHLTKAEARALVRAAKAPHIRLAIMLMLTTAARVGAVLDLTWDRVDLARRIIRLRVDGTGPRKGRATVPINDWLLPALQAADVASTTDYVVEYKGGPVKSIKTGFNAACSAAGLDDVTPHVCRHSAAVWMAEDGVPMDEIAQYLGHEDARITSRVYARFSPAHLRKAAGALDLSETGDGT